MDKILVIQTAFLGDAILTLPMLEKLKEKFPDSVINVLCIPSTNEVFEASPFINDVLVMDKKNLHKSLIMLYKFTREIKKSGYTKIYSPHRSFRTAFIVMQAGVRDTYGFSNASLFHVYRNVVQYRGERHEVQRNLDLIAFDYSSASWRITPELKIGTKSKQKVEQFISSNQLNGNLIAIAPGTIWETKKYPEEYFQEIIRYFIDKTYKILVIGGKSDEELGRRLASGNKNVISACGHFSIIETFELLKRVRILITNDSAPTHMGMCADIPVLTIYCSTIPGFGFYPYNKKSSYISFNDLKCKPCGIHGYEECPIKSFDCGYKLSPKIIIAKIEEMLND